MGGLTMVQPCFVVLLAIVAFPTISSGYKVYWNVPSEHCKRYNITFDFIGTDYGITINDKAAFKGKALSIMYTPGLYPQILGYKHDYSAKVQNLNNLTFINGGLPQDGNMLAHLTALEDSINKTLPDTKTDGLVIIDMEHFGATWAQNFNDMEIYKILSRKKVQDANPTFTTAKVESQAILEYERAATNYIVKTIQYAKALRPYAKWGYYQYPQCFNRAGVDSCSKNTQEENNQMIALWKRSDALFPSAYLGKNSTVDEQSMRIKGIVREAQRVYKYSEMTGLVIPYITFKYYSEDGFISNGDLEACIKVPKEEGADGVVVWGSSADFNTKQKCADFETYVRNYLGPIAKKYIK